MGLPAMPRLSRRYPVGAEVSAGAAAAFRVWAPARRRVTVVTADDRAGEFELTSEGDGYFSGIRPHTPAGTLYRLRLDDETRCYPDPASRYQPQGHDGPSAVVDPHRYAWLDVNWGGVGRRGHRARLFHRVHHAWPHPRPPDPGAPARGAVPSALIAHTLSTCPRLSTADRFAPSEAVPQPRLRNVTIHSSTKATPAKFCPFHRASRRRRRRKPAFVERNGHLTPNSWRS